MKLSNHQKHYQKYFQTWRDGKTYSLFDHQKMHQRQEKNDVDNKLSKMLLREIPKNVHLKAMHRPNSVQNHKKNPRTHNIYNFFIVVNGLDIVVSVRKAGVSINLYGHSIDKYDGRFKMRGTDSYEERSTFINYEDPSEEELFQYSLVVDHYSTRRLMYQIHKVFRKFKHKDGINILGIRNALIELGKYIETIKSTEVL